MCSKNELPKTLFEFVEAPENLIKIEKKKKKYEINNLIDYEKDDINTDKPNLILFNVGGISRYEICSIEKGNLNGQFNYNIIIGANKIYNSKTFLNEVEDYLNGNEGIIQISENDNESKDVNDIKINDRSDQYL